MKSLKNKTLLQVALILSAIPILVFITIVITYYILLFLIRGFNGENFDQESCLKNDMTWDIQSEICIEN